MAELERRLRRHRVHQAGRVVNAGDGGNHVVADLLGGLGEALELRQQGPGDRLRRAGRQLAVLEHGDIRHDVVPARLQAVNPRPFAAFDQDLDLAVGKRQELEHGRDRADGVEIISARFFDVRIALGDEEDLLVVGGCRLDGLDRALRADEQGVDAVRVHDHVAQRQYGDSG